MKFFVIILLSSFHSWNSVYPDDALDILEPSHRLYYRYSKHQSQLPKSVVPSTSFLAQGILVAKALKTFPLASLPTGLHTMMVHTQCVCEDDLCLQPLSKYEHSHYYKFVQGYLCSEFEYLLNRKVRIFAEIRMYVKINGFFHVIFLLEKATADKEKNCYTSNCTWNVGRMEYLELISLSLFFIDYSIILTIKIL